MAQELTQSMDMQQSALVRRLIERIRQGQIVHAYLLSGESGLGKGALARQMASTLLCKADEAARPCGLCDACLAIAGGNHPNWLVLSGKPKRILVEDVRSLQQALQARSWNLEKRAVIIEEVDRMTDEAQNAMLRTMEEPAATDYFFMTTSNLRSVLPTIVSRAQRIAVHPMDVSALEKMLLTQGETPERARQAAMLSQGNPARARAVLEDEQYFQAHEDVQSLLNEQIGAAQLYGIVQKYAQGREQATLLLDVAESLLVGMLGSRQAAQRGLEGIMQARRQLKSNVNAQNVLQGWIAMLREGSSHI